MYNNSFFMLKIRLQERGVRLCPTKNKLSWGQYLVVETNRGIECGVVVFSGASCANKRFRKVSNMVKRIIREVTDEDRQNLEALDKIEEDYLKRAQELVKKFNPNIVVKRAELLFDLKRLFIHFVEHRDKKKKRRGKVHDLAKVLSQEFNLKVELKEAGVRGISKVLGGIGICGRTICCCSVLRETKSVAVRLAKDQGISMSPKNLCGVCGKLKCCLRYEKANYIDGGLDLGKKKKEELYFVGGE